MTSTIIKSAELGIFQLLLYCFDFRQPFSATSSANVSCQATNKLRRKQVKKTEHLAIKNITSLSQGFGKTKHTDKA